MSDLFFVSFISLFGMFMVYLSTLNDSPIVNILALSSLLIVIYAMRKTMEGIINNPEPKEFSDEELKEAKNAYELFRLVIPASPKEWVINGVVVLSIMVVLQLRGFELQSIPGLLFSISITVLFSIVYKRVSRHKTLK